MIIAYIGLEGSGKSYHMAEVAQKCIGRGIDCFGTTPFMGARTIESHRQMLLMENANVFFDEWHQDLDAKEWYKLDPVLRHIVSQHRKYHLTIHWSAQDYFFMDPFIRRETSFVWHHEALYRDPMTGRSKVCGNIPFYGKVYGLHKAKKYNAIDIERKHRSMQALEKKTFFIRESITKTYDSFKKIMLTSDKVSDQELCQIKDPYIPAVIETIEAEAAIFHKRDVTSCGEILGMSPASDDIDDEHRDPVNNKIRLDGQEKAEDVEDGIEGEEIADDGKAALEVSDPSKDGRAKRRSVGKNRKKTHEDGI